MHSMVTWRHTNATYCTVALLLLCSKPVSVVVMESNTRRCELPIVNYGISITACLSGRWAHLYAGNVCPQVWK